MLADTIPQFPDLFDKLLPRHRLKIFVHGMSPVALKPIPQISLLTSSFPAVPSESAGKHSFIPDKMFAVQIPCQYIPDSERLCHRPPVLPVEGTVM
jgi:hypothetical protein